MINYGRSYVVTGADLDKQHKGDSYEVMHVESDLINSLLAGFDPKNDQVDRMLLYEVTHMQLVPGEFDGQDTSDSDNDRGGVGAN